MSEADWVSVIPAPDMIRDAAVLLLSLANDPRDVRTDGNGSEFRIPPYLAERYNPAPVPKRRTKREDGEK